jgi:glycosyltransferase involved in cell wall biosynthesis
MRLLFINRYFYPDPSATSQMLTELAEDLDMQGDTVTVITGRSAYLDSETLLPLMERHNGIEIRRVKSTNFGRKRHFGRLLDYLTFYVVAMWAAFRLKRQDCLIVLTDPPLLSVLAALVGTVKRCRTVCWLQDVFPEIAVQAGVIKKGSLARILQSLAVWSLRRMDRVVVLGRCMEHRVKVWGLSAEKITWLPNWSDGTCIYPLERCENRFVDQHKLQDRFVVMYSGNLGVVHEFQSIRRMIGALRHIEEICFCFVGDGLQKARLLAESYSKGWDNVLFLPYQPKERLRSVLAAAHIHLVSLRGDMMGLSVPCKVYGILAAGRPVIFIGPKESEAASIIEESQCGDIIEPHDHAAAIDVL